MADEPIPYKTYMAEMEELQRLVGSASFDEGIEVGRSRAYILGWIDNMKSRHGAQEPSVTRAERREIAYALTRCKALADGAGMSNAALKKKIRSEIGPLILEPKKKEGE